MGGPRLSLLGLAWNRKGSEDFHHRAAPSQFGEHLLHGGLGGRPIHVLRREGRLSILPILICCEQKGSSARYSAPGSCGTLNMSEVRSLPEGGEGLCPITRNLVVLSGES